MALTAPLCILLLFASIHATTAASEPYEKEIKDALSFGFPRMQKNKDEPPLNSADGSSIVETFLPAPPGMTFALSSSRTMRSGFETDNDLFPHFPDVEKGLQEVIDNANVDEVIVWNDDVPKSVPKSQNGSISEVTKVEDFLAKNVSQNDIYESGNKNATTGKRNLLKVLRKVEKRPRVAANDAAADDGDDIAANNSSSLNKQSSQNTPSHPDETKKNKHNKKKSVQTSMTKSVQIVHGIQSVSEETSNGTSSSQKTNVTVESSASLIETPRTSENISRIISVFEAVPKDVPANLRRVSEKLMKTEHLDNQLATEREIIRKVRKIERPFKVAPIPNNNLTRQNENRDVSKDSPKLDLFKLLVSDPQTNFTSEKQRTHAAVTNPFLDDFEPKLIPTNIAPTNATINNRTLVDNELFSHPTIPSSISDNESPFRYENPAEESFGSRYQTTKPEKKPSSEVNRVDISDQAFGNHNGKKPWPAKPDKSSFSSSIQPAPRHPDDVFGERFETPKQTNANIVRTIEDELQEDYRNPIKDLTKVNKTGDERVKKEVIPLINPYSAPGPPYHPAPSYPIYPTTPIPHPPPPLYHITTPIGPTPSAPATEHITLPTKSTSFQQGQPRDITYDPFTTVRTKPDTTNFPRFPFEEMKRFQLKQPSLSVPPSKSPEKLPTLYNEDVYGAAHYAQPGPFFPTSSGVNVPNIVTDEFPSIMRHISTYSRSLPFPEDGGDYAQGREGRSDPVVDFGAATGDKGAFGWYSDHPVVVEW